MPQRFAPEFSRPVTVDELDTGVEVRREIEANESELAALAARLGLPKLDGLSAEITLRRLSGGPLISASGRLQAELVQNCVATLAPVCSCLDEKIEETFAPEGYRPGNDEDGEDPPEVFDGHVIDVGEIAAQLLSVLLDPYPRAPDAAQAPVAVGTLDVSERRRPFGGLAELLKKPK